MSDYRIEDRAMRGTISITSFVAFSFALALVPAVALGSEVLTRGIWVDGNFHEYVAVSFPGEVWDVAQDDMEVLLPGFHLATVTSQEEQDFISDLLSGDGISGQFWLGGLQDPIDEPIPDEGWTWVTQESWVYTNWRAGEPNDGGVAGLEQHLALLGSGWNDEGSLIARITGYIAEGGVTGLNLVVDSSLDLGDVNPGDGLCATAMATCTLRAAIEESNAYEGLDSITLPADTYVITSSLTVFDGLNVLGEDRDTTIIDADGADVALYIDPSFYLDSDVTIDSVTVRGSSQAGIDVVDGVLSLISSRVRDNSKYGVRCGYGLPELSIVDSEVLENGSDGVLVVDCFAWIVGSSISHNKGRGVVALEGTSSASATLEDSYVGENLEGGLLGAGLASVNLRSTTVANNTAANGAGYLSDTCAVIDAVNSTFSGNRATGHGGGIYIPDAYCGASSLSHTTIAENVADSDADGIGDGGGIFSAVPPSFYEFSIKGTLLAKNVDLSGEAPDCAGPEAPVSAGFNLIGDTGGCSIVGDVSSDITNVDPVLGPLADNGGMTPTHRPLVQSPAINVIPADDCTVNVDQRGVIRPQPPGCDIGSVEVGFFFDGFESGDTSAWSSSVP
ncbi:MAG: choice-of-anchor Q domain-containing protein [Thermoanaerobaculia bacterium]